VMKNRANGNPRTEHVVEFIHQIGFGINTFDSCFCLSVLHTWTWVCAGL
jgi:hypothetical protein